MLLASLPPVTPSMLLVFAVALGAFGLFASEAVRVDVAALIVMVTLMVLGPWTRISPSEGISGFSNEATIVILSMFVLSAGVRQTGAVQKLSAWMLSIAGDDDRRQIAVTIGVAGLPSGFLNNTPVVAMLIPAVTEMARRTGTSPSRLLIPLSYASIIGGTLTLVGTTSNLIASDLAGRLIGERLSMFEFTHLGALVFVVGAAYLLLVGRRLIPERVEPDGLLMDEYEVETYLTAVVVDEDSPFVGRPPRAIDEEVSLDLDVVQAVRDGDRRMEPYAIREIRPGDAFVVRANIDALRQLTAADGLSFASARHVAPDDGAAEAPDGDGSHHPLVEIVIPSTSAYVDRALVDTGFHETYEATVLAIRRSGEVLHHRLDEIPLRGGDTILVQVAADQMERLTANPDFLVVRDLTEPDYRTSKTPIALGIVGGVVGLAAVGVVDLVVVALGGVVAMVLSGIVRPEELYDAVDWQVIFLLAGVIPLGLAVEQTGGADLIGGLVAQSGSVLPPVAVLWLVYVVTVLMTAILSNAASVVLMAPVAVETAQRLGADPLVFLLAAMFATSADFMTPLGYQTNLLVYGPGGYRFTDYTRVGAPLELLLSVVTVLGLATFWGL